MNIEFIAMTNYRIICHIYKSTSEIDVVGVIHRRTLKIFKKNDK